MADLASWNGIFFEVNSDKIFTFENMERSYSARWAAHNIVGKRPKMEFQGPDMDKIKITVIAKAEMGVKPRPTIKKFRVAAKKGVKAYFYVKGKKVVKRKLYIESGTEHWKEIWSGGELVSATADLTFSEYR